VASTSSPLGGEIVFKARTAQTGGTLNDVRGDQRTRPRAVASCPRGIRRSDLDLAGALRVRFGEDVDGGGAGAFLFISCGTPHTWEGVGEDELRFLVFVTPAGFERFFDSAAATGGGQTAMHSAASAAMTCRSWTRPSRSATRSGRDVAKRPRTRYRVGMSKRDPPTAILAAPGIDR
jgi:hypothetical protein